MQNYWKNLAAFVAASALSISALAVAPAAAPTTKPATNPAAAADAQAELERLTGSALNIRAQQTFNRGEYATALPLLKKLLAETEQRGETAKVAAIQERIRVSEKALAAAKAEAEKMAAKGIDPLAAAQRDNSPEARKPHPAPAAGKVYDTTIQDLGNFDYDQEKGGNIPDDVTKLNGSSIRLRGYMIPMDQAENITQFALVPSLFACCFGQPPQIQHTIVANCPKGKAVPYTPDEITVEGTLKVQEKKDDGYIISVFEMDVSSVKLAPKG